MAATGFTPIKIYASSTASAVPLAANLDNTNGAELAINTNDGKLFYKDSSGNVQTMASKATGAIGGSTTQVQFNNAGVLGGSASLTWSGTVLTSSGFSGPLNGTVGATTPAAGSFTTVGASGAVTLSGGTANGVTYLNGSKVLTSGSALTFDGTNFGVGTASLSGIAQRTIDLNAASNSALVFKAADTLIAYIYADNAANEFRMYGAASKNLTFYANASEGMRLTSTGLGIGTSSPTDKLSVSGGGIKVTSGNVAVTNGTTSFQMGVDNFATGYGMGTTSNSPLIFAANGSERMRIDSSGNLGLGVTPSASNSLVKAFDFNTTGGIGSYSNSTSTQFTYVTSNAYLNSSVNWTYKFTGYAASAYIQNNGTGVHQWLVAPSGTAGNAITFTQAMTLDATGDLYLGTTSGKSVGNYKFITTNATTGSGYSTKVNGTEALNLYANPFGSVIQEVRNLPIIFETNTTERARIDSSGNLLVGTTAANTSSDNRLIVTGTRAIDAKSTGGATAPTSVFWNNATTGDNIFLSFRTETADTQRGTISYNRAGGLTAYNTTSDYRSKDIIGPVLNSGEVIDSVPVYMGKMKGATQERPMFIAHETPAYAHTGEKDAIDEDGNPVFQQMDVSSLVPVLWAEIQSLRTRLAALEAK